jgi:hypothetical protein
MESLFTLGEHLRDTRHFLLATVDAVIGAAELDRFAARAMIADTQDSNPSANRKPEGSGV